jgi:uncharacterized protein YegP (UPF0339 family)
VRPTIEVFYSGDGWRFRFVGSNGEIVTASEAYENRSDCVHTARLVATGFSGAPVLDVATGKALA